MLRSYEVIYENGQISWLNGKPKITRGKAIIVIEEDESEQRTENNEPNGKRLAEIFEELAANNAAASFGDPMEWQKETRRDRVLPGREDD